MIVVNFLCFKFSIKQNQNSTLNTLDILNSFFDKVWKKLYKNICSGKTLVLKKFVFQNVNQCQ